MCLESRLHNVETDKVNEMRRERDNIYFCKTCKRNTIHHMTICKECGFEDIKEEEEEA